MKTKSNMLRIFIIVGMSLFLSASLLQQRNIVQSSSALLQGINNCIVNLEFNQDGVLPSGQGLSYFAVPFSLPENSVFSVSDGLLHINTFDTGAVTWYQKLNAYDPSLGFILEFRMRVFPGTGPFGIDFEVSDDVSDFEFGFADNGISLPLPGSFFPFNTTDDFHTYKIVSPGGSTAYELFIDGALVISGNVAPGGDPGQRFLFGDGTTGSDGRADVDFIRYCQFQTVQIDIKPGSFPNSINLGSGGTVPVAIISTAAFDARTVDSTTVTLAGAQVRLRGKGTPMASFEDVNGDGLFDLVVHVSTEALQLSEGDTEAILEGQTYGGTRIRGVDFVRIVP